MPHSVAARLKWRLQREYYTFRYRDNRSREYSIALPEGYGHKRVVVRISVPKIPKHPHFAFAEHVMDDAGKPTRTVIATALGGFAISHDLAESWRFIPVRGREDHAFIHVYSLGNSEYLAQVKPAHLRSNRSTPIDLLVVDERGQVLAQTRAQGPRWHSCRAVHMADDTLMYAEYPRNKENKVSPSRVFRSRDRGRSWQVVFEQSPEQVRHFHFLQPRPGLAGEWWLTSGDAAHQSKIWITQDDGDTWQDITADSSLMIEGATYPRSIFRLTDLVWNESEVIWGTDDVLAALGVEAGARVFRSQVGSPLVPRRAGRTRSPIRSIVDLGDFFIVLTQASTQPTSRSGTIGPGVFLMPKDAATTAPGITHLFDIENFDPRPGAGKGFTYSMASRVAFDGTFFTYRAPHQALPLPGQILKWAFSFD
jgi:hypothetical protein